jgi:hypothetical protein
MPNNVKTLRIRKPDECSDKRIEYYRNKLRKIGYGWNVKKHPETGECYFYNEDTIEFAYNINDIPRNSLCSVMGGKRKTRKLRRKRHT